MTPRGGASAVSVLREARSILERPEAWTKGAMARRVNGSSTKIMANGVSFCLLGACKLANLRLQFTLEPYSFALDALADSTGSCSLDIWNDKSCRTHAEVLAALDRAIEIASR